MSTNQSHHGVSDSGLVFCVSPTVFSSKEDAATLMQAIIQRLQNIPGSILAILLFGGAFVLGLAIFAFSQSLVIAAATMALVSVSGALATRELSVRQNDTETRDRLSNEVRQQARRMAALSDRMIELEAELRDHRPSPAFNETGHAVTPARDLDEIVAILSQLIKIVEAQEVRLARFTSGHRAGSTPQAPSRFRPATLPPQPVTDRRITSAAKPSPSLTTLQTEGMLRDDILNGRMKIELIDLVQMLSGRVSMRELVCTLDGRLSEFRHDTDLLARNVPPGIMQLFDRVRFGFAFEMATQMATQGGAIPILCPIMNATFRNTNSADEIVSLIESEPSVASRLVLAFDQSLISSLSGNDHSRISRLSQAGLKLALRVTQHFDFDPAPIEALGFGYVLADAKDVLTETELSSRSSIHTADLASYFERYGLMLVAINVQDPADLIRLKGFGIACAGGAATMRSKSARKRQDDSAHETNTAKVQDESRVEMIKLDSAPLRERLRRVQA